VRILPRECSRSVGRLVSTAAKYEQGTNRISASKLFELARLYNAPVQWFFEDFEDLQKEPAKVAKKRLKRPASRWG
jgi:transcriptional regulator with XRE-family HTH domain